MEENREPLSAIAIEKKLQLLRNKHFSEDTIALVKSDYEYGLKEEEISLYLNKSYDGYQVGIVIKSLRIQRNLTKEALATELGISESTIKKYENGERALSITNLFKIIDYFKVDANTILNVAESKKESSIDSRLELMDCSKRAYFQKIFNEMLDNAEMLVS